MNENLRDNIKRNMADNKKSVDKINQVLQRINQEAYQIKHSYHCGHFLSDEEWDIAQITK